MNGGAVPDPLRPSRRPAPGLDIRLDRAAVDGRHRLALSGELDLSTAPLLEAVMCSLVAEGRTRVAMVMNEVAFCDVAGLNRLIATRDELVTLGGELVLHGPCPSLQLLLDLVTPEPAMELAPPLTR